MRKIFSLLIMTNLALPATANERMDKAKAFTAASHAMAESWGRTLVNVDLNTALEETVQSGKLYDLQQNWIKLGETLKRLSDSGRDLMTSTETVARPDRNELLEALNLYDDFVRMQYEAAFVGTKLMEMKSDREGIMDKVISSFRQKCVQGRSSAQINFLIAKEPPLPPINRTFYVGFHYGSGRSGTDSSVGFNGDVQGASKESQDEATTKGMIKAGMFAAGVAVGAFVAGPPGAQVGGAIGGAIGAGIAFIAIDMWNMHKQDKELREQAEAIAYIHNRQAVSQHVAESYRRNCKVAVKALEEVAQVFKLTESDKKIWLSKNKKFFETNLPIVQSKAMATHQLNCRMDLVNASKQKLCLPEGTAYQPAELERDPLCAERDSSGRAMNCPKIVKRMDTGCRVQTDGSLIHVENRECSAKVNDEADIKAKIDQATNEAKKNFESDIQMQGKLAAYSAILHMDTLNKHHEVVGDTVDALNKQRKVFHYRIMSMIRLYHATGVLEKIEADLSIRRQFEQLRARLMRIAGIYVRVVFALENKESLLNAILDVQSQIDRFRARYLANPEVQKLTEFFDLLKNESQKL